MTNKVMNNETILIIDDEVNILKLLKVTLEGEGYNVVIAADGAYGMQIFRDTKIDLVLLDIKMPGPDGHTVAKSMREFSDVPIIMITGNNNIDSIKKAFEHGVDDYITKPFYPSIVSARVRAKLRLLIG